MKVKAHKESISKLSLVHHTLLTAEDLWKLPNDGYRCELVKGVIHRTPLTGFEHGVLSGTIGSLLEEHINIHCLGAVCSAGTGFKISQNPDTVRAPDAAFVRQESIDAQGIPQSYWDGAPDLAVEVISPSDTYTEVEEKVDEWLIASCAMVWVINPRRETVEVYRSPEDITVLQKDDILDGGDVIEGFQCPVKDIFV